MNHLNISLLPSEYKSQKRLKRKFSISTIAMCIVIGVLIFINIIVQILSTIPQAELKVLNSEIEIYDREINSLMKYRELTNHINKIYTLAKNAAGEQIDWPRLFVAISETTPDGLQINEISTENLDQGSSITIRGNAKNHEITALWAQNLRQRTEFTNVKIQFSHTTPMDLVEFEIYLTVSKDMVFQFFEEVEQ